MAAQGSEMGAEFLARLFHEAYERLAPEFGYRTREASAVPWEDVPENNKRLMIATAEEVRRQLWPEVKIAPFAEVDIMTGMSVVPVASRALPPLIDPDCRADKCGSCVGGPCEHHCHQEGADVGS